MKLESIWTVIKPQFADYKPNFMVFFFFFTLNDARNNTNTKLLMVQFANCKPNFMVIYLFIYFFIH